MASCPLHVFAEKALKVGNLAVFNKHVQHVFKEQQGYFSAAPTALLGGANARQILQSGEAVAKRFAEHFAYVLNCPVRSINSLHAVAGQ